MTKFFKRTFSTSIILLLLLIPQAKAQTVGSLELAAMDEWSVSGPNGFFESGFLDINLLLTGGPGNYFISAVGWWVVHADPGYSADPEEGFANGMFTISEVASSITLTSFIASSKNGTIELSWETASETNNARFVIYRNNEVIGSVDGAGSTCETQNYSYNDNTIIPGLEYTYVLADISFANELVKHDNKAVIISLNNDIIEADYKIGAAYPNPFNPTTVLPIELNSAAKVKASIYNLNGHKVKDLVNCNFTAGTHDLKIDGSNMSTGIYMVNILVNDIMKVQKIAFVK